ncbi:class I SAM-dependent methyltransferase [Aurantivibrio plasticivorans]
MQVTQSLLKQPSVSVKPASMKERIARKAVFKVFENLRVGSLIVEEGGEVFSFGSPKKEGDLVAKIQVRNPAAYLNVLMRGTIGSGESYMQGDWTTPDLTNVIRIMVLNMSIVEKLDGDMSIGSKVSNWILRLANINTLTGSKKNIGAHYDLGNDFFELFLDQEMMYSSAIYDDQHTSLDKAAVNKLRVICEKLKLNENDHLLEIGTGWGGMAIYAAQHYGCRVTTTTISQRQFEYASRRVEQLGLSGKIQVLLKDYRELEGRFDKIVSIEMIEAVGHQYYQSYFSQCSRLLKEDGLMLIQAITIPDQRYHAALKAVDFIQKYIFPGGCLPSNEVIAQHVSKDTDMQIVGLHDITNDYARTLKEWRHRFNKRLAEVKNQGFGDEFARMWEFYLCYCEGGFAERVISTAQILLAKPQARIA